MLVLLLLIASIASDPAAQLDLALAAAQYEGDDMASLQAKLRAVNERIASLRRNQPLKFWPAVSLAVEQRKPIVLFLGVGSSRAVNGAVVCQEDYKINETATNDYPGVLVGFVEEGWVVWRAKLLVSATDADIQWVLSSWRAVQPAAVPFSAALPYPVGRDDSPWLPVREQERLRRLWPASVPFPDGLRFYRRTTLTQRVANTSGLDTIHWYGLDQDDYWVNAPTAINPNRIEPWRVPGGLENVLASEWSSYVGVTESVKRAMTWRERVPIANGGLLPKDRWEYPKATTFVDMLASISGVFEIRQREKVDGGWKEGVVFIDREHRPNGYTGAGKRCSACHDGAGSSLQYGITVRGDDTVFSWNPLVKH